MAITPMGSFLVISNSRAFGLRVEVTMSVMRSILFEMITVVAAPDVIVAFFYTIIQADHISEKI